jgi:hypothetical protein
MNEIKVYLIDQIRVIVKYYNIWFAFKNYLLINLPWIWNDLIVISFDLILGIIYPYSKFIKFNWNQNRGISLLMIKLNNKIPIKEICWSNKSC